MKMQNKIISEFQLSDMIVRYTLSSQNTAGFEMYPANQKSRLAEDKEYEIESLIQVMIGGDDFPGGFSNGHTLRNAQSCCHLKYQEQRVQESGELLEITTLLQTEDGQKAEHILAYQKGREGFTVKTRYGNESEREITLEMLSSFSIGGITPFEAGDAPDTLLVHRLRSKWSAEGRLETQTAEELQLEPSWAKHGAESEKFGQLGSLPVRKYFPFVAVEDQKQQVIWAVQVGCPSSWQMEVYRKDDGLCISGGLPDFDFGHWSRNLAPGEWFETPTAYLTVYQGNLDDTCQRLTRMQDEKSESWSAGNLPLVFNEYCTTWGMPSHENISKILDVLKGRGIEYFVIDAGWYADPVKGWQSNMGDWQVYEELFPYGLQATVDMIKSQGMIPGIWFELETCGRDARAFHYEDHLLKRNGKVITVASRRFWDMRDPWTVDYLTERVIGLLNRFGFGYIKIDYNETIGIGCDGAKSLGEGLRQNMQAAQEFFRKIKREVPGIVIEVCASGGHRLEPSYLNIGDVASFSDAHEEREIPVIAANLHRAMLPKKSQIWSVLRKTDSSCRIAYSMAAACLGMMCLSGEIYDLSKEQWALVDAGISFYKSVRHIICNGVSRFYGPRLSGYRHLKGWQGVLRFSEDGQEALLVIHSFARSQKEIIQIPVGEAYGIAGIFTSGKKAVSVENAVVSVEMDLDFDAIAIHFKK